MKGHALRNDARRDAEELDRQRAAQQLGPGNRAHCQTLAALQPLPELPILRRAPRQRENHKAGVEMDHRTRPRGPDERRSERTCWRQRSAAGAVSLSER